MSEEFTSIGELSKQLDMSQRTIRYYEEIGLTVPDHLKVD